MLDVLTTCFPDRIDAWTPQIKSMIPAFGEDSSAGEQSPLVADTTRTATVLHL
jgi:malate dehydrogenase (quinone)